MLRGVTLAEVNCSQYNGRYTLGSIGLISTIAKNLDIGVNIHWIRFLLIHQIYTKENFSPFESHHLLFKTYSLSHPVGEYESLNLLPRWERLFLLKVLVMTLKWTFDVYKHELCFQIDWFLQWQWILYIHCIFCSVRGTFC